MGKSWGHTIRPLNEEEIQNQVTGGKSLYEWRLKNPMGAVVREESEYIHQERKCRISSKCQNESIYMLKYSYVTGRAGRTSYAEKPICEIHAQKYIK